LKTLIGIVVLGLLCATHVADARNPNTVPLKTAPPKAQPLTYQQEFDQSLDTLNSVMAVYSKMDCHDPSIDTISDALKEDLVKFSHVYVSMPSDANTTRDIEISFGVVDLAKLLVDDKAKCRAEDNPPVKPDGKFSS
jgi:hypothetical protein